MAKYYIIWVEGISWKRGEKVCYIHPKRGIQYTLKMMNAMRVKECDLATVKYDLMRQGLRLKGVDFVSTSYAPPGTIYPRKKC